VAKPWAPRDPLEVVCGDWIAHSSRGWTFGDLDDGRRALLEAARWQTRLGALTPDGRTLALCPGSDGARLWMLTPEIPSCWELVERAARHGDGDALAAASAQAIAALAEVREALARLGIELALALDVIAWVGTPRLLLVVPEMARPVEGRLAAQLTWIDARR
jgi:hypothetical protein